MKKKLLTSFGIQVIISEGAQRMQKWKPTVVIFVLVMASSFGFFTMFGTEVATGTIVGGNISVDTTWTFVGSPYIVMENVIVDPGVTLTIEPGVEVKFDPPGLHDYLNIFVEGVLLSVGQVNMPISFTSNSASPSSDWDYLQINTSGIATLENCSFSSGGGLNLLTTTNHNIIGNAFNHYAHVRIQSPSHYVANNRFSDKSGISVESVNNTINNNSLSWSSIWLSVGNNVVSNNRLSQGYAGTEPPIAVDSDSNNISGNILSNTTIAAIRVRGSFNIISANWVTSCKEGIELWSIYHNNTVSHNEISGCGIGIDVPGSDDNKILLNSIDGGSYGIKVGAGDRNQIVGNEVSEATSFGIQVRSSSGNQVHHNVLIDNAIQAEDDQTSNSWDDGYPSGGNYWSDYLGSDSFQGPNQIIPGADGIGDTPYPVNPNGTDRFPLTDPTTVGLPPRNVDAHLSGAGYENVTITWNLSWNDGQRSNDVTGYEVYRSTSYDKNRTGYSLLGSAPNQTTAFMDTSSGEGDPNNYFYYVCGINGTGNSTCSVNQVAKFTRSLSMGPNLISIPLLQSDDRLESILQTVSFDDAWFFDSIDQTWRSFTTEKPYGKGLAQVNCTMGIWIDVTLDSNLTVAGRMSKETSIHLTPGWNLVGYPSIVPMSFTSLQNSVSIIRAEAYEPGGNPYHLMVIEGSDLLLPGAGYWLYSTSQQTISFEN